LCRRAGRRQWQGSGAADEEIFLAALGMTIYYVELGMARLTLLHSQEWLRYWELRARAVVKQ